MNSSSEMSQITPNFGQFLGSLWRDLVVTILAVALNLLNVSHEDIMCVE